MTILLQVGVKALLRNSKGDVLIVRRSAQKYGGHFGAWDIPGGRIEAGAPLIDNLRREVREETGLEIGSPPKLIAAQDILTPADRHVVRLTYVATAEGEPKLDITENTEYKWVTLNQLQAENDLNSFLKELFDAQLISESSWS